MKVTYGNESGESRYIPNNPFPELRRIPPGAPQRDYIVRRLREMIADGTFSVTDCLAQGGYVRDMVGLTLKNMEINPDTGTQVGSQSMLPPDISGHTIKVRCIPDRAKSIRFKRSTERRTDQMRRLPGERSPGVGATADSFAASVAPMVPEYVDYEAAEADLSLSDAWVCLAQHGEHCRPAKRKELQEKYWLYKEVRPEAQQPEEEKRGPGRPRKN